MRWIVTVEATNRRDIERLLTESADLSRADSPREAVLELRDALEEPTSESRQAIRARIETRIRHLNGAGKLRWGRAFEGVTVKSVRHFNCAGESAQVVFVGTAYDHLTPHEFGDMVETLGHPRPDLPFGCRDVEALDFVKVAALADTDPVVARVLRLVEVMLVGDEGLDWSAAYSALEVIESDAGVEATAWRSENERRRFKGTANSYEAAGDRSRHGKEYDAPKKAMSTSDGSWFVRGVAARWLGWRLDRLDAAT